MPTWKVKEKTIGKNGLATTKTVTTEDPNIARSLLNKMKSENWKSNSKPKQSTSKEPIKQSLIGMLKDTFKAPEVKLPKENKKEVKKSKALPAPKKSEEQLKAYIYKFDCFKNVDGVHIYAINKKDAETVAKEFAKVKNCNYSYVKTSTSLKGCPDYVTAKNAVKMQINKIHEGPKVPELKLPEPKKNSKPKLSRKGVTGKGKITHNTRNLNESQVHASNYNSFTGKRGDNLKKDYEAYRHLIEFSGLSKKQKDKLLDKLYKLYAPILKYDSQYYSSMVSGPARYPEAKMRSILQMEDTARSNFYTWWNSVEKQIKDSTKSKATLDAETKKAKGQDIEGIKKKFNLWYERALADVEEYKKKNYPMKHNTNLILAQNYLDDALKTDKQLYLEMFEKLNKLANYSKNSNVYKAYKAVTEGKVSTESIQAKEAEDNKVIYKCDDYTVRNMSIQAGKRIAIEFTFYPKPQLVYALKKRGFTWYSFGKCFICKPEKFDLEWAKGISKQYEKYI